MPSREPELYKDKIEVSLDSRQIFYLFFGGAVIVGVVFVLGVLVGRRVEARGHIERAATHAFYQRLGQRTHISDIPDSFQNAVAWFDAYDKRHLQPDQRAKAVERATRR